MGKQVESEMINENIILYALCKQFIVELPKINPQTSLRLQLNNNILDINLPRQCGKTGVARRLALEYSNVIIVSPNRHMARVGYPSVPSNQIVNHTKMKEEEMGTRFCSLENKVFILDESLPFITPEDILENYLRYPHQNRSWEDLVWQAPKIIALGTRYNLK